MTDYNTLFEQLQYEAHLANGLQSKASELSDASLLRTIDEILQKIVHAYEALFGKTIDMSYNQAPWNNQFYTLAYAAVTARNVDKTDTQRPPVHSMISTDTISNIRTLCDQLEGIRRQYIHDSTASSPLELLRQHDLLVEDYRRRVPA